MTTRGQKAVTGERAAVPVGLESSLAMSPAAKRLDRARGRSARHPFLSSDLLRSTLPFVLVLIGAIVLIPLAGGNEVDVLALSLATILAAMLVAASVLGPWQRLPGWARMIPPLGLLVVIALLREAAGEGRSGFAALMLIVPVWAALYEGPRSLIAAVAGVALTMVIPVVLIGAPEYPAGEQLRETAILVAVSIFIGVAVHRLVQDAHDRASEARRSRRFLLAAMSSAVEGFVALDARGRVVFANSSAQEMLGRESEQLLGGDFHALLERPDEDAGRDPEGESPLQRTLRTGEPQQVQGVLWRADGSSFPVVYRCASFTDSDTGSTGVVLSFVDIAEQRRVERVKDELVSVVGHELRTPLTSIRGSLGVIEEDAAGSLGTQSERMIEIAISNADRLSRLIDDILDIERIESGKAQFTRRRCEASDLISTAIETLATQAEGAGVGLEGRSAEVTLWADPDRILQTLLNLISNAIKFSPAGSTVDVIATREGDDARFDVVDRGRGIPAEKLDTVFERFGQVDASDSRDKGGTGLGLPICRSIVNQHGGRIWIESPPDKGTTVSFTIQVAVEPAEPGGGPEAGRHDDAGGEVAAAPAGARTILIVDDEPDIREIAATALEAFAGWHVVEAGSGEQGIEMALADPPDAVLLDAMMPGLDGPATLSALRRRELLSGCDPVPVVMLTADTKSLDPGRLREIGAQGLVAKPFDPAALAGSVAEQLGWD